MNNQIIILMGVAGSGKSTIGSNLSQELDWKFIDSDRLHPQLNLEKMKKGLALTDRDRKPWLQSIRAVIDKADQKNENIVIACSALKESYREYLIQNNKNIKIIFLKGDLNLIQNRLLSRPHHFFNPRLLQDQFDTLEEPRNALYIDIFHPPKDIVNTIRQSLKI